MNVIQHVLVHLLSGLVIAGMLGLCLRSPRPGVAVTGRRVYRAHPAWYVFCALGGGLLVAIFALATTTAAPADKITAAWCSAGAAALCVGAALILRLASVTIDEHQLTSRTLIGERTIALAQIESVAVLGLSVTVRLRADPATKQRPRALNFFAGLRGLGDLVATLRERIVTP